jgi:hypothetical protein
MLYYRAEFAPCPFESLCSSDAEIKTGLLFEKESHIILKTVSRKNKGIKIILLENRKEKGL